MDVVRAMGLVWFTFLALAANFPAQAQPLDSVAAAFKDPSQEWKDYPTRTLANLPADVQGKMDSGLTPYGGLVAANEEVTGFFHTKKLDGRWWLVDPIGSLCVYKGVASVTPLRTLGAQAAFRSKFGSKTNWAAETTGLLRKNGFIAVGAWSDTEALRSVPRPLAYTRILNLMSSY